MDLETELRAPVTAVEVFAWVDDLASYPRWMPLVHSASALPSASGLEAAWQVELRGRIGPLARSKRLRMVRTAHEPDRRVRFERRELDGRSHSPWVLDAVVAEEAGGAVLTIHLHYGGALWTGGLLERALSDDIERARERLLALLSASPRR